MNQYIIAIDQGTTGTTAVLVNAEDFTFIDKENHEFSQIFPKPSWVEHNLNEIWESVQATIKTVIKRNNVNPQNIVSIGITNQRETTCAFNKKGEPLANAIVWQDRRTFSFCQSIKEKHQLIKDKTGLPVDPYFSGTKMNWLLSNNKEVKQAAENNNLNFGTIDTFLLYKLTGNTSFKTEASNASRTLLMNLSTGSWDNELLEIMKIKKGYLAEICDSFSHFGDTKGLSFLPDGISITGILGDQQSALFGQSGVNVGDMKCTYGTGAFMLLNTGTEIKKSDHGLLSTVAYKKEGQLHYALEGSAYIAGAAVQWLRDQLNLFESSPEVESLANSVKNLEEMEHILFLPFFTGIGSPHWNSEAKATITGLSRDSSMAHISRACLEGIALSINDIVKSMRADSSLPIKELKVDGGAVSNNLLMNLQASFSSLNVLRPEVIETTAFGAALAAAHGKGLISFSKIESFWKLDQTFKPEQVDKYFEQKTNLWNQMIKKLY